MVCIQILAVSNNAEMNSLVHVSFCIFASVSVGESPRSGMAGSKGKCIWHFAGCCQVPLHRGYTILHSHHQIMRVSVPQSLANKYDVKVWGFCQYDR